jgi:hypothetical protein
MSEPKRLIDWDAIEKDWRAGIKTKLQLSEEFGVSRAAMDKHFKKAGIDRDLSKRIQDKAEALVAQEVAKQVTQQVTPATILAEKQIVEANAEVVAKIDLINRKDVLLAIDVSRNQLQEVADLGEPDFRARLEWLGEVMDTSTEKRQDKANELYRYIIGLAGRVKLSKEIAAAHGVYIPMQRKILKLDAEGDRNQSNLDALLAKINAATD